MQIIRHRINTIAALENVPTDSGCEIDIRSRDGKLILQHDPFADGENFADWLACYRHGTLILNVKEEWLEEPVLDLMRKRGLDDFFFLDLSFPSMVKQFRKGMRKMAVRYSEYESIETVHAVAGLVDWVWIDRFTRYPGDKADYASLKNRFKLCVVSPELVTGSPETIGAAKKFFADREATVDAVCTKHPEAWSESP